MGAPSDNDRNAAPDAPLDDQWTAGSSVHNDRTTHGLYVDPSAVAKLTAIGTGESPVADKTTIGTGDDRIVPTNDRTTMDPVVDMTSSARTEDSTIAAIDNTMAKLEQPKPSNDRTRAGIGVPMPAATPVQAFAVLRAGGGKIPLEKERELVQPERSPLAFVMRDIVQNEPTATPQAAATSDDSQLFADLVGNQPPPRVVAEPSTVTLQPVARRSRRHLWIAAGALVATALVSTAVAMKLTGSEPARPVANEAAKVTEHAPTAAPAPTNAAAEADPFVGGGEQQPAAQPAPPPVVAMAEPAAKPAADAKPETAKRPATKTSAKKKTVAKKSSTSKKKSSTAKTSSRKKRSSR